MNFLKIDFVFMKRQKIDENAIVGDIFPRLLRQFFSDLPLWQSKSTTPTAIANGETC